LGGAAFSLDDDSPIQYEDQMEKGEDQVILRPDIQLGYRFMDNHLTARVGLFEGQIGAGVDYEFFFPALGRNLRLTLEARQAYDDWVDQDIDERTRQPLIRAEVSAKIWKYLRLHLGASRLTDEPEFFAGITFEYEDPDIRYLLGMQGLVR
jgi:hypothetical protein